MNVVYRCVFIMCLLGASLSYGQEKFPIRSIHWVVGATAGGATDIVARTTAMQVQKQMGQSIIVDNKPGGSTIIAANSVARAPADGYTVLSASVGTLVYNTALFSTLPYDPMKDFIPIGMLGKIPLLLVVSASSGIENVEALIQLMRETPEKFAVGSAGIGSPHHIALEFLKDQAQLEVLHIPYKGNAPAIQDILAGVLPVAVADATSVKAALDSGKVKALATFTAEPLASMPDIPSLVQMGLIKQEVPSWMSMVVPHGTPATVVERLSDELRNALNNPEVELRLLAMAVEPWPTTSAQMREIVDAQLAVWPPLLRARGVKLD